MKKYFFHLSISLFISIVLTAIYYYISYEIPNLFLIKLQFSAIPGIISILISVKIYTSGSMSRESHHNPRFTDYKEVREDKIEANRTFDTKIPMMLALLTTGIIMIAFSILIVRFI